MLYSVKVKKERHMPSFGAKTTPETNASRLPLPQALLTQVQRGISLLKSGGVVAIPTDTLYGLAADFSCISAIQRLIRIKGRPDQMGFPLLLSEPADLSLVARDIPRVAWDLAHQFWPGALTLVIPRSPAVPDLVTGGRDTVAVRVPNHPVPIAIARGLGRPITGTSANRSGLPPALTAQDVRRQLGNAVDMILKGGDPPQGVQSTIVDVTGPVPRVLRQGAVSLADIQSVCHVVVE